MDNLSFYLAMISDSAWIAEMLLLSLTWVVFCIRKHSLGRVIVYTLGLAILLSLSNLTLFLLLAGSSTLFPILWSCVHGAVSFVIVWWAAPFRPKSKLLLWIAVYNVVLTASCMGGQCSMLVSSVTDNSFVIGAVRTSFYVLMPLAAMFMRRARFDDYLIIPNSCLLLVGILLVCAFSLSITETVFFFQEQAVNVVLATAFGCLLATDFTSVQTLNTVCAEQQSVYDLTVEKQRYLSEREISAIAESSLEDLRYIRHDLKNQYGYLQILLEQKRYDELSDYLRGMQQNLPPQLTFIDCGNRTVNTVLNMEFSKLRVRGIKMEHQLVVPPVLPFRDEDVCSLLANLMDNAREECCRLQDNGRQDVKVRLEIHPHHSYLLIRCLNSTDRTELHRRDVGLITTKPEREVHGFGTRIIVKLSEKYNGCADFLLEHGMFVAQVMLDITERDEK